MLADKEVNHPTYQMGELEPLEERVQKTESVFVPVCESVFVPVHEQDMLLHFLITNREVQAVSQKDIQCLISNKLMFTLKIKNCKFICVSIRQHTSYVSIRQLVVRVSLELQRARCSILSCVGSTRARILTQKVRR
jgi:hypothetical protein